MTAPDPRLFDTFAPEYDVITGINSDLSFFLDRIPPATRRVLDVGCGTGHLAIRLAAHFDEVIGIDLSGPMLDIAGSERAASNITYLQGDIDSLDLEGEFDMICSSTTFHHLPDPGGTARRLSEKLEPGGVIAIVDCVQRGPRLPNSVFRQFLRAEAVVMRVRESRTLGRDIADQNYRARSHPDWIEHLVLDRFLSPSEFRVVYGDALPGAEFLSLGWFDGVAWVSGADGRPAR